MAQMSLHMSTANGDHEVYPVYELDYSYISNLPGFGMDETSDTYTNKNYKARRFHCTNATLRDGISANVPLLENEDGNIIPFWHRFRTQMMISGHNCWVLDEENREAYAAIQQGVRPDDWGANPNYITLFSDYFTMDGNSSTWFNFPRAVFIDDSFNSSTSYYEDTKRTELRMFFTDTGNSFSVWKKSISRGAGNTLFARQYGVFRYPKYPSGSGTKAHYDLTNDVNSVMGGNFGYKVECGITSEYNTVGYWQSGSSFHDGANCPMIFVHFKIGDTDFYGVALIQMSSFTGDKTTCFPQAMIVSALDTTFWGTSILPGGGGGEGSWGGKTVRAGGNGTFSTSTSQRDKAVPGTAPADIVATINVNLDDKIFGTSDLSNDSKYCLQTFDETNWKHFIDVLYSDDFIKKYTNAYYNPMSAIPVAHLLPEAFVDERLNGGGSGNKNKINVSAAGLTFTYEEGGGSLNVKSTKVYPTTFVKSEVLDLSSTYYDAFPDYEGFTKITVHIPFIGDVPIDVNKVMGGRLQITLACDCQNGNLAAWIWTEDKDEQSDYTLIATGNCSYPLPVASMSSDPSAMGKIASGLISAVGGLAAIAAAPVTGGASLTIGGAAAIAAGSASAISGAVQMEHQRSTQVRYNNSGALSLMTDPELWVEITRPVWVEPENYQALYGLPAFTGRTIMECPQKTNPDATQAFEGFLVIDAIDLTGIEGPTEEEKQMIEEQLAKGVFIDYDHIGE